MVIGAFSIRFVSEPEHHYICLNFQLSLESEEDLSGC